MGGRRKEQRGGARTFRPLSKFLKNPPYLALKPKSGYINISNDTSDKTQHKEQLTECFTCHNCAKLLLVVVLVFFFKQHGKMKHFS